MTSRALGFARLHALEELTAALCLEAGAPAELVQAYPLGSLQREVVLMTDGQSSFSPATVGAYHH